MKKRRSKPIPGRYEVGYGRAPVAGRFKPGQSGNPNGRPSRRSKPMPAMFELLSQALRQKIRVEQNGRAREIVVLNAIIQRITHAALKGGDLKAIDFIFRHEAEISRHAPLPKSTLDLSDMSPEELSRMYRSLVRAV
jgi:Family of unknown function (DUF5681)